MAHAFRLLVAGLQLHGEHVLIFLRFFVESWGLLSRLHDDSCTYLSTDHRNFRVLRILDMGLVSEHIRFIYASKL